MADCLTNEDKGNQTMKNWKKWTVGGLVAAGCYWAYSNIGNSDNSSEEVVAETSGVLVKAEPAVCPAPKTVVKWKVKTVVKEVIKNVPYPVPRRCPAQVFRHSVCTIDWQTAKIIIEVPAGVNPKAFDNRLLETKVVLRDTAEQVQR